MVKLLAALWIYLFAFVYAMYMRAHWPSAGSISFWRAVGRARRWSSFATDLLDTVFVD
jgi:hypothetical protein